MGRTVSAERLTIGDEGRECLSEATYVSKAENPQGTDSMEEHADSKHPNIDRADDQVVDKVSGRESSHHATNAGVSINAFTDIHRFPLFIGEHSPQGQGIDEGALHQRHNMHIPVQLCPPIELGVVPGEEERGQPRGDDEMDELVHNKREQDLVDVV